MGKSAVHIGCIISSVCMLGAAYARDAAFENAPYMNPAVSAAVPEPSWRLDFEKDGCVRQGRSTSNMLTA